MFLYTTHLILTYEWFKDKIKRQHIFTNIILYFYTSSLVLKELLAKNVAYISMTCSVLTFFLGRETGHEEDKTRTGRPKKNYLQYLNAIYLKIEKNPAKTWHKTWEMQQTLQLMHLVFAKISSEMISVEGWLSRSQSKERQKMLRYAKLEKNWNENQCSGSSGVMDPNLKVLVQTLVSIYRGGQERSTMSIYTHL